LADSFRRCAMNSEIWVAVAIGALVVLGGAILMLVT
jgi:hypothetical protein